MMQIISHTPIYAWILFGVLLWKGWKARKTRITPWKALLIMPAVMSTWSIYSIWIHYEPIAICLWAVSIALGVKLGWLTMRKLHLRFDKEQKLVEASGSWTPMLLSVSIFSLRYFLGVTYGLHPELAGNAVLLGVEALATVVSGMFTGRLMGCWERSKTSPHVDLIKAKV